MEKPLIFPQSEYFFNKIKPVILFIYHYECVLCSSFDLKNHVHHIDKCHNNNDPLNLTCLCEFCHIMVHSRFKVSFPILTTDQVNLKIRIRMLFGK